jgi:hypothetical protein
VESSSEFRTEPSGSIKMLGNYRVSKQLGISRVVLSSMELGRERTRKRQRERDRWEDQVVGGWII